MCGLELEGVTRDRRHELLADELCDFGRQEVEASSGRPENFDESGSPLVVRHADEMLCDSAGIFDQALDQRIVEQFRRRGLGSDHSDLRISLESSGNFVDRDIGGLDRRQYEAANSRQAIDGLERHHHRAICADNVASLV
jgi:hypothetical protein